MSGSFAQNDLQLKASYGSLPPCIPVPSRYSPLRMNTGWQRPIGCLKLQVIFRKRATHYRVLLMQMTYKEKASYMSSPPCSERKCMRIWSDLCKHVYGVCAFARVCV